MNNESPDCNKCFDNGYWIQLYERPGMPPGNFRVPCDNCEKGKALQKEYDAMRVTMTTTCDARPKVLI